MLLSLLPLAAAHADSAPHVHGVSPFALLLVAGWALLGAAWWRRAAV